MRKNKKAHNKPTTKGISITNEGSTLFITLPDVDPQVQNFIIYQTMRFIIDLIDGVNGEMTLPEQMDTVWVNSR